MRTPDACVRAGLFVMMTAIGLVLAAAGTPVRASSSPATPAASAAASKASNKGSCSLRASDRSPCAIKIVMKPAQLIVNPDYMTIDGAHIPDSVKLYLLKNALHRAWSYEKDKRSLVVCRRNTAVGFRTQGQIYCLTNGQHMKETHDKNTEQQSGLDASAALGCGAAPEFSAGTVKVPPGVTRCLMAEALQWAEVRNLSTVLAGMSKLPRAGGTQTLKIKRKGRLMSKWTFEDGRLVAVWNRKPAKDAAASRQSGAAGGG